MDYNKENKNHLLIQKKFWKAIVKKEKTYEYRKLSKGLITGDYYFFSTETKKYLGSAYLTVMWVNGMGNYDSHLPTRKWVNKNYWNHDYICYAIDKIDNKEKD